LSNVMDVDNEHDDRVRSFCTRFLCTRRER
jgi:hypothetical protein